MAKVKVFSTPTCPWCTKAKDYFKEKKIEFEAKNVAEDLEARKEMVEKSGQMGVPVIMIDDEVIVGFNKSKIDQLLKLD
ncbi:MAG: putative Thioredoxin [Candidatus Woesearchaeota archaeon]|nr:putative Thioredoxin [Candidatus Woesearchaeota archaeon]